MPIEVPMGAISPTMSSGQIVEWRVKVGDKVKEGDTLADIQTDKAVMPLESFDEGIVAVLCAQVGDEVPVGEKVLILAAKGEDPKAIAAASGGAKAAAPAPAAAQAPSEPASAGHEAQGASEPYREMTSSPTRPEVSNGQDARQATASEVHNGGRIKSTPLARKIAASAKLDLGQVPPSGPGGRVIRRDVEAFLATRPAGGVASKAAPSTVSRPSVAAEARRIPHTPMRKTIASRMVQAKQTAPEIHVSVDIRVDEVVAVRERLNKQLAAEKIKLSMGDFVTKAVALALRKHPGVNATFEPDAIVEHPEINVGIAVAMEGGLMVPVLHNADTLGLREVRTGSEALVEATRSGKLSSNQLTGGTFTISNLGMYGVKEFDAILNLPQVGILAVGAAEKRPVVVGDTLKIGTVMTVNLTVDHRAVDGAMAAEFLRTLKGFLEEPASMLL
ncbi:dihydrolipoamide acetyltransferase family protein [Tundrisphaera lichenicola]|uniref:dihydrolipoamide acetyltransferase family protein n=1 Tax=Tundrisphaera lichenicola TaxID=2029860 RepID=UPI003EB7F518